MQKDLPEDAFVQYSADNVDLNICTIDRKGTFNGMGIISMVTHKNDITLIRNRAIKRLTSHKKSNFVENKGIPITCYIEIETSGLSELIFKQMLEIQSPYTLPPDTTTDFLWQTSYFFHQHNKSSWSGFMQTHTKGKYPGKTCVVLLPIINLNPSNETCI